MRIKGLQVRNFRLLSDVQLELAEIATVIVGRNNSGKTSLSELFRRLTSDRSAKFSLEDFSSACFDRFVVSYVDYWRGVEVSQIRESLPFIELRVAFSYDSSPEDFGPLAHLVIDLDPTCTTAVAVVRYELEEGGIESLFDAIEFSSKSLETAEEGILAALRTRIPDLFKRVVWAEDPNDASNRREIDWTVLERILCADFVSAQRGLDDITTKESDSLAKIFESLFVSARATNQSIDRSQVAAELESAVEQVERNLDSAIKEKLQLLVPSMHLLGYPGLDGLSMFTETRLEVSRLLSDNMKVRYAGYAGVPLPESYNGLGARNLILMLLRLVGFYRRFAARGQQPGLQLVFIEEPEVHLHPQMQEVFIRQLDMLARNIAAQDGEAAAWPVQFVVSTHSSHIANEAPFTSIRYFLCKNATGTLARSTLVKDLSHGLDRVSEGDIRFIHQYLTLTKCDLFFADKAILVEGTTERLLLPRMLERLQSGTEQRIRPTSQYLTILEVGGAYAQVFFPLLDFLEIPSLIVTDLDSVGDDGKACAVEVGTKTSNACIKEWVADPKVSISELLSTPESVKVSGIRRIAYQTPEDPGGPCGRSFEDAFMLANKSLFELDSLDSLEAGRVAYEKASHVKKAEFALTYATVRPEWESPRYIADGLDWLLGLDSARLNVDPGDPLKPIVETEE